MMETAISSMLSHPNIVQVWATKTLCCGCIPTVEGHDPWWCG
jgi:hypothetical protein